jgi:4-diphosphocytidyl-2-C-methyl-D-erythritol kinase
MSTHRYPAPAKINLHLDVTALLDNGYHTLDTSFAYVDCMDTLTIEPADSLHVTCSATHLQGEENLVHRVLDGLRRRHGIRQGLRVHIDKHLPEQAGLGGGSSDAATALMVANRLWGLNLGTDALIAFAAPFGADIPCFLFGEASIAHGIGEKLQPWPQPLPGGHLCLAHPGVGLSTAAVFDYFDRHVAAGAALTPTGTMATIRADSTGQVSIGFNALESSAVALAPEVGKLLDAMHNGSDLAWMSGSGSTCVALCDTADAAARLTRQLREAGLADWTHGGRLLAEHPLRAMWKDSGA